MRDSRQLRSVGVGVWVFGVDPFLVNGVLLVPPHMGLVLHWVLWASVCEVELTLVSLHLTLVAFGCQASTFFTALLGALWPRWRCEWLVLSHTTHLTVSGKVDFLYGPFFEPYRSLMAFHDSNDQQLGRRRLPLDNQWGVVVLDAYANGSF